MTNGTRMGPGAEFDRVRAMICAAGHSAVHIGDDAAVLDFGPGEKIVVSTDTSVEDVHFRRGWMSLEEIGYRAVAAALSDIAAMGALPRGVVVAYGVPATDAGALEQLARGAGSAAAASDTLIVGGDVSSSATLTVTATVLGVTQRPLLRSGARDGDLVYVTGILGGPLLALKAFRDGMVPPAAARDRFVRPLPRIREAQWLAGEGATSCIDISDGLAGDLWHLAAASGVAINIRGHNMRLFDGTSVHEAIVSGEEYELCVTMPEEVDSEEFERQFGIPLSLIGNVAAAPTANVDFGSPLLGSLKSFNHFVDDNQ